MTGLSNHRSGAHHGAGDVTRGGMTLAEALEDTHINLMIDKWHIKPKPLELGFERYFGSPLSAVFWWPEDEKTQSKMRLDGRPYSEADMTVPVEQWYLTTEVFSSGSDAARKRRYERRIQLGIMDPKTCPLAPLGDKTPTWKSLSQKEQDYYQLALAIHTAMVDRLDQELGRLFEYLKDNGMFNDTVIFFMSDNGASAEGNPTIIPPPRRMGDRGTHSRLNSLGASVCNTPLRGFKSTLYEGGTATPMIFHWPRAIGTPGRISGQVGHLSDIFPTVLDILDMEYPAEYAGRQLYPLRGQSLLPQIRSGSETPRTVCWNYERFSAVRMGNWKAVRQSKSSSQPDGTWQLYDLSKDRSETSDLAESNPERVESLAGQWNAWHQDIGPLHKERPVGKEERKKSRSKK